MKYVLLIFSLIIIPAKADDLFVWNKSMGISTQSLQSSITFGGAIITIRPNGKVEIKDGVTLDEASQLFWKQVQNMGMKLACEPNKD